MKSKKTISFYTLYCALIVTTTFISCQEYEPKVTVETDSKGGEVRTNDGILTQITRLNEFEYKGHTYINCRVRDGISLTHAGHCACNIKKVIQENDTTN